MLGDEGVEVVLVLDAAAALGLFQVDLDPARVRPVLGVDLLRLEEGVDAEPRAGVCDLAREGVLDREVGADAAALGPRARRVEVDRVEALEAVVLRAVDVRGQGGRGWRLVSWGGGGGLLDDGWLDGGRVGDAAHNVGVVEVVNVGDIGVRVEIRVGDFFYPWMRHGVWFWCFWMPLKLVMVRRGEASEVEGR